MTSSTTPAAFLFVSRFLSFCPLFFCLSITQRQLDISIIIPSTSVEPFLIFLKKWPLEGEIHVLRHLVKCFQRSNIHLTSNSLLRLKYLKYLDLQAAECNKFIVTQYLLNVIATLLSVLRWLLHSTPRTG